MADQSDDLDQLLDSALDDFQSLNLASSAQRDGDNGGKQGDSIFSSEVQGLGLGLPDLKRKKKGKQKVSRDSHVSDALDKLREQTRESVKGLESITGHKSGGEALGNDATMEDLVKQFEELAGSQDLESMVENMMQQLLSKEILHEPMKEIAERYPKWLEDNKDKLGSEEYGRFAHQHQLIKELNEVYETDPSNFNKIVELMQKMQECGQPPSDIVLELGPEFDLSTFGQLPPEMLDAQQNCCIM